MGARAPGARRIMHARFNNIAIAGVCAAVPANVESIAALMEKSDANARFTLKRVAALAGLKQRHVCPPWLYTGDLALAAGKELLERLDWDPASIGMLVFVTQTPDFLSPPTGYLVGAGLGFAADCAIIDVTAGCSGMIQGAWLASGHVNASLKRALIIAGDAASKVVPQDDVGNSVLMGDGVGAMALEFDESASPLSFHMESLPDTRLALVNYDSGYRPMQGKPDGMVMDGNAITEFCLMRAPQCMAEHLALENLGWEDVARFYLHQPNKMILDTLKRRLGIDKAKIPMIFAEYANCSSGSLPINMCVNGGDYADPANVMFCAFGSGLSVASMLARLTRDPAFPLVLVEQGDLRAGERRDISSTKSANWP